MTTAILYNEINKANHSRENRLYYAQMVLEQPTLVGNLLEIIAMVDDPLSCRAAWALEFACKKQPAIMIPYLDSFTKNMHRVHLDSAVRPIAKICEILVLTYYSQTSNPLQKALTIQHQEAIIESSFNYLINDEKVAAKAYSMTSLYLLGRDHDWIHPELTLILERDYHHQSAAFKARAKQILKKIKKISKA